MSTWSPAGVGQARGESLRSRRELDPRSQPQRAVEREHVGDRAGVAERQSVDPIQEVELAGDGCRRNDVAEPLQTRVGRVVPGYSALERHHFDDADRALESLHELGGYGPPRPHRPTLPLPVDHGLAGGDTSRMPDGNGSDASCRPRDPGWGVNVVALLVVDSIFDGVEIGLLGSVLIGAAVLGIANAIVKPILTLLALPLILLTLGLAYFAINVLMLAIAEEWVAPDFSIDGFWNVHRCDDRRLAR